MLENVKTYLLSLQNQLCDQVLQQDPHGEFVQDNWVPRSGGLGLTRVFRGGAVFEKAGVNFSHVEGDSLPPAATRVRPHLAGLPFGVVGVSVVIHPLNPFVPTTHFNLRFFHIKGEPGQWWFGGGFDLTPYYPFYEDVYTWHEVACAACKPFGEHLYPAFKEHCDHYFYLKHREEMRGVGGLFFDDFFENGFDFSFALSRSVGDHFAKAYFPIVERRKRTAYDESHRAFQLYRRGRYVEFNLLYDRGTLFGIQSGGRTESILMSLPPQVHWIYDWKPQPGSREASLCTDFLIPRDWLHLAQLARAKEKLSLPETVGAL